MAVFAKLAYDEGLSVDTLLLLRFGLAAAVLGLVAALSGAYAHLGWPAVTSALALGSVGYATQAGSYFAALTHADASLVALVFCTYPLWVMTAASALGRERVSRERLFAMAIALAGVPLVLGGTAGSFSLLGTLLAAGSAIAYTTYILLGDRYASSTPPIALSSLVCAGAFVSFAVNGALRGRVSLHISPSGWLWVLLLVAIGTVGAIVLFFVGMSLVGPTTASLLSAVEPAVTVLSVALVFGEQITLTQAAGGTLIITAVLMVQRHRPTLTHTSDELSNPATAITQPAI